MTGASGGSRETGPRGSRAWLLQCRGMHVEDQDGEVIGTVVAPVYEHSARWDRPVALEVHSPAGSVTVPIDWVTHVDESSRRVVIGRRESGLSAEDTPRSQ